MFACLHVCMVSSSCTRVRRAHCAYAPEGACGSAYACMRMHMRMHLGSYACGYAGIWVLCCRRCLLALCAHLCVCVYTPCVVRLRSCGDTYTGMHARACVCVFARLSMITEARLRNYTATHLHICAYARMHVCMFASLHGFKFVYEGSSRALCVCSRVRMR